MRRLRGNEIVHDVRVFYFWQQTDDVFLMADFIGVPFVYLSSNCAKKRFRFYIIIVIFLINRFILNFKINFRNLNDTETSLKELNPFQSLKIIQECDILQDLIVSLPIKEGLSWLTAQIDDSLEVLIQKYINLILFFSYFGVKIILSIFFQYFLKILIKEFYLLEHMFIIYFLNIK